ncbi:hypothetical protein ACFLU1_04490 [Chloroflexota bacterium]
MIHITERAKEELKRLLSQKVEWPYARLRLIDRGQEDLGLGIDVEMPGDQVVEYQGIKILVIEHELAKKVKGITLDVENTADGPELVLDERTRNI